MTIVTFGRMPASSQASSELSTASLTLVSSALRGLSNPSRCRFLAKNSETAMSFCLVAIVSAVSRFLGFLTGALAVFADMNNPSDSAGVGPLVELCDFLLATIAPEKGQYHSYRLLRVERFSRYVR